MELIVATWMYSVPTGDAAYHPQVGKRSDTDAARAVYWRCAFVMLASARRQMPSARLVLLFNEPPPSRIDGINLDALKEELRIEYQQLRSITRPPADYHPGWNTQFIVLDALDTLASLVSEENDAAVLLLDGDCVFIRPFASSVFSELSQRGALTYKMPYAPDHVCNGLNHRQLTDLAAEYDPPADGPVHYCGGEFIFVDARRLGTLRQRARQGYDQSLERHLRGAAKFCEEAHLLSYVYQTLAIPPGTADRLVRRIWTDRGSYSNVAGDEAALTVWHLPAEKHSGFLSAFQQLGSESGRQLFDNPARLARLFRVKPAKRELARMLARRAVRAVYHRARQVATSD